MVVRSSTLNRGDVRSCLSDHAAFSRDSTACLNPRTPLEKVGYTKPAQISPGQTIATGGALPMRMKNTKTDTTGSIQLECADSTWPSHNERSEWKTAIVDRELARYHVDLAALSETRFTSWTRVAEGTKLHLLLVWRGLSSRNQQQSGETLRVSPYSYLGPTYATTATTYITNKSYITLLRVYAPTMTNNTQTGISTLHSARHYRSQRRTSWWCWGTSMLML